jgi:hypothetical protein
LRRSADRVEGTLNKLKYEWNKQFFADRSGSSIGADAAAGYQDGMSLGGHIGSILLRLRH